MADEGFNDKQDHTAKLMDMNQSLQSSYGSTQDTMDSYQEKKGLSDTVNSTSKMVASNDVLMETKEKNSYQEKNSKTPGIVSGLGRAKENVADAWKEVKEGVEEMSANCDCTAYCKDVWSVATVKKKLPFINWLPSYRQREFFGDLIAGLTVGLTVIPQGLAYATVAELPPQYGLYSAFMGCFVYVFLGTAKDITLGPTAIMSLMTAAFASSSIPGDPTIAIMLSLVSGIVQLLMGILNLGFLVDFISSPVISSFTCAAAITIAFSQIKSWLGLKGIPREFIPQVIATFKNIPNTNIYDFILGAVCMILLFIMKRLKNMKWDSNSLSIGKKLLQKTIWFVGTARNAIIVVGASGIAAILYVRGIDVFTLTGNIKPGLPEFEPPSFSHYDNRTNTTITTSEIFSTIGAGVVIVPLLGLVELVAIGKSFARKNRYKIDATQELVAIGVANILGSFVSAYPVTGSFSRTAVNDASGVRTPAGGIWTGTLVVLALAFLTPLFFYIPKAALAGVIIMAVVDMIDFRILVKLWRIKKVDIIPWAITFIFSFIFGIEYGIIIGVVFSLLMLMYPWARPGLKVAKEETESQLQASEDTIQREVAVIQIAEGIRFPGIEYIKDQVWDTATADDQPRSIVIDCRHLAGVDYSCINGIHQLFEELSRIDILLVLCNLRPEVLQVFQRAAIPGLRYFSTQDEAVQNVVETNGPEDNPRQRLIHQHDEESAASSPRQSSQYGSQTSLTAAKPEISKEQSAINNASNVTLDIPEHEDADNKPL